MNITNNIIQGDCIEVMKSLPDETFDFCFADPPYFLQVDSKKKLFRVEGTEFKGCNDDWDKFESMDKYKEFTRNWLKEVKRLLKPDGSICVISGMQSIFEIGAILRELGYWVINDIVWKKSNPTPNFSGSRLNNSHETIIWATKSKKSHLVFNYKTGKFLNKGKQMGSVWEFPVCSGNERIKDTNGNKLHTTQKPLALIKRLIVLFTKPNSLILDPFGGTMTTAAAAKMTGRNYTMIELDKKYIEYGIKRLNQIIPENSDVNSAILDKKPLKVTIKEIIDNGLLKIGEELVTKNGQKAILVDVSGKAKYKDQIKSIHEIAALMLNKKRRINAFDFLFVIRNDKMVSLGELREIIRRQNNN